MDRQNRATKSWLETSRIDGSRRKISILFNGGPTEGSDYRYTLFRHHSVCLWGYCGVLGTYHP